MKRIHPFNPIQRPVVKTHYRTFSDPNSYGEIELAFRRMSNAQVLASQEAAAQLIADYVYRPKNDAERRAVMEDRKRRGVVENDGKPLEFFPVGEQCIEVTEVLARHAAMFHAMQAPDAEVVYSLDDWIAICSALDPGVYSQVLVWSQEVQGGSVDEGNACRVDTSGSSAQPFDSPVPTQNSFSGRTPTFEVLTNASDGSPVGLEAASSG